MAYIDGMHPLIYRQLRYYRYYSTASNQYISIARPTPLWPSYATSILSITDDGFQSGYRSLSVRWNGPSVAQYLCRKATMSLGLAPILASSSDMGMYVTSSFFLVFSSYSLNISLNDYLQGLSYYPTSGISKFDVTLLSPAMANDRFFSCSGGS